MKEGWEYKKLGEVCDLYQPKTISTKEMVSDGLYDVFGANGKIGKYHSYNHEDSEILMTCRGATCGNINISTPKSWINGNAMVVHIKDEEKLDRQFLVYSLINIDKSHIITGAAQPQITRQTLSPLQICFPSLSEQQSIVDYLNSAFANIDAMKANAGKALNEAKALFQASLKEMLEPKEGWEEKKLGDICDFRSGFAFKSNKFTKIGEPIIRISDIQNEEIDDSNLVYFDSKSYTEDLSKYLIYPDDILIAMSGGTTGKLGINTSNRTFYLNQRVGVFRENKSYLNHRYLYHYLHTKSEESLRIAAGAAQPNLSTAQIKSFIIPVPSLSEQRSIVATLDSIKSKVDKLQANYEKISQECDALKQAILRQVFE